MYSFTSDQGIRVEVYRHQPSSPWTYVQLDLRQKKIAEGLRQGHLGPHLLVSELSPVITLGRRAQASDLWASSEQLREAQIETVSVDRGGLATYHGLGQWVVFPVDRLDSLTGDPRGVKSAVERLLQIAWTVGQRYTSGVEIRRGAELGVWSPRGKFAAVGVQVDQGVLLHGLCINGFKTPQSFFGLRPCGLDLPVDYLLADSDEGRWLEFRDLVIQTSLQTLWQGSKKRELMNHLELTENSTNVI